MSKLISLFLLPTFIIGAELCNPSYWELVREEEVSLEAYQDIYYEMRNDESLIVFSDIMNTKDGPLQNLCVTDREDFKAGPHNARMALCLKSDSEIPYCYFEETSFLELALRHSSNFYIIEKLWKEGFNGGLEDVFSGEVEDRRYASADFDEGELFAALQELEPGWQITDLDYGLDDEGEEDEEDEEEERVTVEELFSRGATERIEQIKSGIYGNISLGKVESKTLGLNVVNSDTRDWSNPLKGSDGGSASVAVGYKHGTVSVEYESSIRQLDSNSYGDEAVGTVDLRTNFVNAHLDVLDVVPFVQPFIGVGGGRITHGYQYNAEKEVGDLVHSADQAFTNSGWTYQYIGGLNLPITDNAEITLKARYLQVPDVLNMGEWDILRNGQVDKEEMFRNPVTYEHKMDGYGLLDAMVGFTVHWKGW